jgi:hypothetical protein
MEKLVRIYGFLSLLGFPADIERIIWISAEYFLDFKDFKLTGIVAEFNEKSPHNFPTNSTLQNRENCSFFWTSKPINYRIKIAQKRFKKVVGKTVEIKIIILIYSSVKLDSLKLEALKYLFPQQSTIFSQQFFHPHN